MSDSLGILFTGVVTVRGVEHFDLAVCSYGKSLSRSLMCFDFSHFSNSFSLSAVAEV